MKNDDEYTSHVLDDEEKYCKQMIALLRSEYVAAARRYIDRLEHINLLRPSPPVIINDQALTNDQLRAMGVEITDK